MQKISTDTALKLILEFGARGKVFSVVFRKRGKDRLYEEELSKPNPDPVKLQDYKKVWREMVCRLNVKKGVKGVGQSYNPTDYGLITVYDMGLASKQVKCPERLTEEQRKGLPYRNIPVDSIVWLKINGASYLVV